MNQKSESENELFDELAALGTNLANVLRAAWASPERQRAQAEVEAALQEVAGALSRAGSEFLASPTGQNLQSEIDRVRQTIRAEGLGVAAQAELLAVLKRLNVELRRAAASYDRGREDDDPAA